jgi:hypothetical protein
MTALEFLEDTVKYFSEDPNRRCKIGTYACSYVPVEEHQTGCAIGRFLDKELRKKLRQNDNVGEVWALAKREEYFEQLVPEWMQKIPTDILLQIQKLHDVNDYWNKCGLSQYGKEMVQKIKELINNNI